MQMSYPSLCAQNKTAHAQAWAVLCLFQDYHETEAVRPGQPREMVASVETVTNLDLPEQDRQAEGS